MCHPFRPREPDRFLFRGVGDPRDMRGSQTQCGFLYDGKFQQLSFEVEGLLGDYPMSDQLSSAHVFHKHTLHNPKIAI